MQILNRNFKMNITKFSISVAIITTTCIGLFVPKVQADGHKMDHVEHEIGLQLYSLRNQMKEDVGKAIKQIHDWDIDVVEGGGALYGNSIHEFKAILEQNKVSVVSVDSSVGEIRDNPMGAVYKADFYGAKYATIYWMPFDNKVGFNIENAKALVKVLNEGGKILKQHGVTLQYHPHGYEFGEYKDGTFLDYIIQNTTESKFQMDVFWVKQGGGDPVAILQKYPNRFTSLHVKDRLPGSPNSSDGTADVETNVVLGSGDIGIAAIIKEAKKQGIQYFFIEDESSRVIHQVPKSKAFIESL